MERIKLTEDEFSLVVAGSRFSGRSLNAARAVLVGGATARGAAREYGISDTAVNKCVNAILVRRMNFKPAEV